VTFSIRPFCFEFLESVSKHYEIYIFTASYSAYARAIMNFLNKKKHTITGYLSRENCLQTSLGLYIKDLIRIANRDPHQMLIVDNMVHSFGKQVDNGIPILEYNGNPEDQELIYLEKYLVNCSKYYDVREFNREFLKLSDIVAKLGDYFEKE
jgi:CTD small phosphatase-like protein 2